MRLKCKTCHIEFSTETMRHSAKQCNTVPLNNDTWETTPRQSKSTECPSWGGGGLRARGSAGSKQSFNLHDHWQ